MSTRILRENEVRSRTGLSRTTRWRLERQGNFPLRRRLSANTIGWVESEIEAVFRRLDLPVIEAAGQLEVQRQEERLQRLRRRIIDDDGRRPHLRAMLDDEYEQEARHLDKLRDRASKEVAHPDPFTPARWEELTRLCADLDAIWRAATTTHDRKQLLRIVIQTVIVEVADRQHLKLRVEWTDGLAPTSVEIPRSPYFRDLIWQWSLAGRDVEEIVKALAELGARTKRGRIWSHETVRRTIDMMRSREVGGLVARRGT
jgi:prophage regulatory protein